VEQPTNVIHLACYFNKIRNKHREYKVDVGGSNNVLQTSINSLSVKQLIFSSSAAIYGAQKDNNTWLKESDQLRPGRYRYGINKKLIEDGYFRTPVRNNLNIISLRLCTVVGPAYNKPGSVVSVLLKSPFLPKFCMENILQFMHSDNLVSLPGHIIDDMEINGVFNLAPDSFVKIKELVSADKFISVPLFFDKGFLLILWNLKVLNLQPAAIKTSIYQMILDPSKIISRYNYKYKFSSEESFMITLNENKIPLNSGF
jgi:UDP-glucose 4-epimerase